MEQRTQTEDRAFPIRKNCGRTLILAAKVIKIVMIIFGVIIGGGIGMGAALLIDDDLVWLGILFSLAIIPLNVIVAIILGDILLGYGQLVENSAITASAATCLCAVHGCMLVPPTSEKEKKENVPDPGPVPNQGQTPASPTVIQKNGYTVTLTPEGIRFSGNYPPALDCPFCGKPIQSGRQFCSGCGAKLFFDRQG